MRQLVRHGIADKLMVYHNMEDERGVALAIIGEDGQIILQKISENDAKEYGIERESGYCQVRFGVFANVHK